jgi:O-antigen/teichoic acid export membrane protein
VANLLIIKNKQKMIFWAVFMGTLVSLATNYFLIPKNGFVQGGWTLIISELVILGAMIVGLKKSIFPQKYN